MKFSIRDLFLVTVVVALALGWWVDRSRLANLVEKYDGVMFGMNPDHYRIVPIVKPDALPNSSAPAPNQPKD